MATTNPVFQVLVTAGDQAPLAAGNPISALQTGQIGVFNYHTGLSLGAASIVGDTRDIFLAVGTDVEQVGTMQDINKSAGQVIQVKNAKSYTVRGYVDDLPKIIDLYGFKAKCATDYAVKIELRNGEIYGIHGYNQFTKTFNYRTGCCADECVDCGDGDCNELAQGIAAQINSDRDALIIAELISNHTEATVIDAATADGTLVFTVGSSVLNVDVTNGDTVGEIAIKVAAAGNALSTFPYTVVADGDIVRFYAKQEGVDGVDTVALTSAGGTGVTIASEAELTKTVITDVAAFIAANPGVCLGVRLTSVPSKVRTFCSVNAKYYKLKSTNLIVSLPEGFSCNGTLTTVEELAYSEGKGNDIKQLEYFAGGFNGKPGPYRVSTVLGLAREGFVYFADKDTNYNTLSLTYDQLSVGGWLEYMNNLETIIAIPCDDTTTLTGLVAIFDAIFTQFQAKANDVATMECANGPTSGLADNVNGISSLS